MTQTQTLYIDTEKSGADYIDDYAALPGVAGPLWGGHKIPVLGVCGEIGQGKTTFLLDIACGPVSYVDLPSKMIETHANGWKPIDVFLKFLGIIRTVPPGRFRVIALDVSEEIESGIADWVWENPLHFNHTKNQYMKMAAVYQGDVSSYCKMLFTEIASKCETFAFANHVGLVFDRDGKATGEKKNKGRPVFKQLAALYLKLAREKDAAGNMAAKPSGSVDLADGGKARLRTRVNGEWVPILPPRLPVATPDAIRAYIANPPNYAALRPEERNPEHQLTEEQRAQLRIRVAQAEGEAERLRIERLQAERAQAEAGPAVHSQHVAATPGVSQPPQPQPQQTGAATPDEPRPMTEAAAPQATAQGQPMAPQAQPPALESPADPSAKQLLRDRITAAVQRLELTTEAIQERIKAVNEGVITPLGRLGEKKLGQILVGLEAEIAKAHSAGGNAAESAPGAAAAMVADPATIVEKNTPAPIIAPNTPPAAPLTTADLITLIRRAWSELVLHLRIPEDQQPAMLAPLLARYGASKISDLTAAQLGEVNTAIVDRLRKIYDANAALGPCPF